MGEITCSESKIANGALSRVTNNSPDLIGCGSKEMSREGVHEENRFHKPRNVPAGHNEAYLEKRLSSWAVSDIDLKNIDEEAD